jgi:hypothetical protein
LLLVAFNPVFGGCFCTNIIRFLRYLGVRPTVKIPATINATTRVAVSVILVDE